MDASHTHSTRPRLPQGIIGQVRMLLFQPENFFKSLGAHRSAWLLMAIVLMLLTGVSEVQRQQKLTAAPDSGVSMPVEMPMDGGMGGPPMMPGGEVPLPPVDGGESSGGPSVPLNETLEQVLGAGGTLLAFWALIVPLLALVMLFNGHAPRWSRAVQVAVWSAVPLGVLALLQLAYYSAGGKAGEPGLAGLLDEMPFYGALAPIQQSLLLSLASKVTLFHGWMLALLYLGARHTLRGKRVIVMPIIVAWLALVVLIPVALGAYAVEPTLPAIETLPEGEAMAQGEFGSDMGDPSLISGDGTDMLGTPDPFAQAEGEMTAEAEDASVESTDEAVSVPDETVEDVVQPTEAPIKEQPSGGKPSGGKPR